VLRSRQDLLGTSLYEDNLHDSESFRRELLLSIKTAGHWEGEVLARRSNGESFSCWVLLNILRNEQGKPTHYVCVSRDITALKQSERQLKKLAFSDALTGLPNRALFNDRLRVAVATAQRAQSLVGIVYINLDRLKYLNDSFGHVLTDLLLKEVAARLVRDTRASDTVARLSGDEFVILLMGLKQQQDIARVAQAVLDSFVAPFEVEERKLHLTASVGVSVYPDDGDNAMEILKNAGAAMVRAKEQGGNCFQFYTQEMGVHVQTRVALEHALHRAVEQQEFELHYQPKVDLQSGQITGVEALIRWRDPELGMVPPDRFIPLAEETGLILPIGEWVLRTACRQAQAWHAAGHAQMSMAVNLSARQFRQQDVAALVRQILSETGLAPHYLELELTESLFMKDGEAVIKMLREIKAIGVTLALDDFGTGYSSLSYLRRFPIDVVKIDRSFINDVTESAEDASLTKAIIAMGRSLNMKTVAEGVETEAQLKFLINHQCDAIQGYYFSRPLPADALTELLREGKHIPRASLLSDPLENTAGVIA